MYTSYYDKVYELLWCNSSVRLSGHFFLIPLRWQIRQVLLHHVWPAGIIFANIAPEATSRVGHLWRANGSTAREPPPPLCIPPITPSKQAAFLAGKYKTYFRMSPSPNPTGRCHQHEDCGTRSTDTRGSCILRCTRRRTLRWSGYPWDNSGRRTQAGRAEAGRGDLEIDGKRRNENRRKQ